MAFDHRLLATDGLFPSLTSHWSIAILGHLLIDVIIEPPLPIGLGGSGSIRPYDDRYKVTIVIRKNGKTYTQSKMMSKKAALIIQKIVVKLKSISAINIPIFIHTTLLNINKKAIAVITKLRNPK
jgi:hypothetical protein